MSQLERQQSVSAVIIDKGGKVLLLHRSDQKRFNPGMWNVIAGKRSVEESPRDAVLREVLEETGSRTTLLLPPVIWHVYQPTHNILFKDHAFLVTIDATNIQLQEEHTEYAWVDPFDLGVRTAVPFLEENLHMIGITRSKEPYRVLYTNYKGETEWRLISPTRYYFGHTEYHPDDQWLLEVHDHEKQATRTYAVADIHVLIPPLYKILQ